MARKPRRRAFPADDRPTMKPAKQSYISDDAIGGVFGFFRDFGTRETIESIIIAVILAMMFRAYEAEAFIIPTGSMAPSLQGEHKDLECENCGYRYRASASEENRPFVRNKRMIVPRIEATFCPICQYRTEIRSSVADHTSNRGDRILVNKFIYDFSEPERYDVIVFKYPNNGKQNYIKRLIGLPGDNILIDNGDIYLMFPDGEGGWDRKISRKPAHKLKHVLQVVDDTDHIGHYLEHVKWPSRWQEFAGGDQWETVTTNGHPAFITKPNQDSSWLRYRHFRPMKSEWPTIENGTLPERFEGEPPKGRLIADNYAYNDSLSTVDGFPERKDLGLHWVGDIGIDATIEVQSSSGILLLDLVEGGAHFTCQFDVATGEATLSCDDPAVEFKNKAGESVKTPVVQTSVKGAGNYNIEYVNADDQIHLWVDGALANFDAATYERSGYVIPKYSEDDPGDAEPAGIAGKNLAMKVDRLKILRDLYHTSVKGTPKRNMVSNIQNETEQDIFQILRLFNAPERWSDQNSINYFELKKQQSEPMFQLKKGATREKDQFLPMGDNSPESLDGRVWPGNKYVQRDLLIGRALFIYWPHSLNEPIKFFPNFGRMGFIR